MVPVPFLCSACFVFLAILDALSSDLILMMIRATIIFITVIILELINNIDMWACFGISFISFFFKILKIKSQKLW